MHEKASEEQFVLTLVASAQVRLNPLFTYRVSTDGDLGAATSADIVPIVDGVSEEGEYPDNTGTLNNFFNFDPPPSGVVGLNLPSADGSTSVNFRFARVRPIA